MDQRRQIVRQLDEPEEWLEEAGDVRGQGELFSPPDVNGAREFFRRKSRDRCSKLMSVAEAVSQFVHDGDYIASGGFGGVRIATAILHEIVRQRRKDLGFSGHTATHDFQILAAGEDPGASKVSV
jgi:glutaconate CoA-transferase subunit A